MPKSKESTARITMFNQLKIPFVYTLEASFAGANKGNLSGQHFSMRDLINVGKYILKALWECKKLSMNKNLLREITMEALSLTKNQNDKDSDCSDKGCSSSEDELIVFKKNNIEEINDEIL